MYTDGFGAELTVRLERDDDLSNRFLCFNTL